MDYSNAMQYYYAVSARPTQPDTTAAMALAPQPFYYNGGFPLHNFHSTLDNSSHSSAVLSPSVFPNSSTDQQATPSSIGSILREDDARRSPQPTTSHFADELTPTVSRPLSQPEAVTSVDTVPLRYKGRKIATKFGKNHALLYCIPETRVSYTFYLHRKGKKFDVYRCSFCKAVGATTSVKASDDFFLADPCTVGHRCTPRPYAEESTKRVLYKKMAEIRSDKRFTGESPHRLWLSFMQEINQDNSNERQVKEELLDEYFRRGFDCRKRQLSRNLAFHKDKRANMGFVPDDLVKIDGSTFLQERESNFHVYYSVETIKEACKAGLHAIVADGVHTPQPKELGRNSQLYCLHGVCDGDFDMPLLFAITAKKTERVYARIFGHFKNALELAGRGNDGAGLRIVLDFEKAAINAAMSTFPAAKVEGCAFHLAQAWNRRKTALGLQEHIQGPTRDRRVARWWALIKGTVFLPNELRDGLRALRTPPVSRDHPAYRKCAQFLRYLHSTWLTGPFKDLWSKWKISTLRTTNVAEAFHSVLKKILKCDHPELGKLIEVFQDINLKTDCLLRSKRLRPDEMKRLRRRDADRRDKIDRAIIRFAGRHHSRGVTSREVRKFCIKMSRHVTGKAI